MKILNQQSETVAISALKEHPRNPNRGDVDAIESSIHENGFYGAVVAQKSTGYILAGNHRYKAAQQAGAQSLPVIWVDVDDTKALKILLADNRTAELAHRDNEALAALLQELSSEDELVGSGYGDEDLEALLKALEPDGLDIGDTEEEETQPQRDLYHCPKCGFEFSVEK